MPKSWEIRGKIVYTDTKVHTAAGDFVAVNSAGVVVLKGTGAATGVTLPGKPELGRFYFVKDGKGDAGTNNITITPVSGTIDGAASFVLNQNYAEAAFRYNGTEWNVVFFFSGAGSSGAIAGNTLSINGDATIMTASYYFTGTPAATNQVFWTAPRACKLTTLQQVHSTAAGGTSTLDVTKDTGTAAPAGGTVLTSAPFNLNATANTVQNGTLAVLATITMAKGDRLAVKFNHAIQSSAGVMVQAGLAPL